MTRRKRRIGAAMLCFLAALVTPTCDAPPLATGAYVQAVTTNSAVIARWTASPQRMRLVVRQDGREVAEAFEGVPGLHHELLVTGLAAGARHDYELTDENGGDARRGSFLTRSDDDHRPLHFAVFGDSGGQPWWVAIHGSPLMRLAQAQLWLPVERAPCAVADLLLRENPDFALLVGDVIYPRGELENYHAGFFRPFGEFIRERPIYPVLGNHDLMTANGAAFLETFTLPEDGLGERCFTVRDGPLRVIGLDLNGEVDGDHRTMQWLRRVLQEATEPWLLVYSHYPLRSVYREAPRADLMQHYGPLCREFGVDLICAGHDHNYQRYGQPGETLEVVTGGGGKSLYAILHRPEGLVVAESAYHASFVTIDGLTLRLVAKAIDGRILDDFTIDKSALLRAGKVTASAARLARMQSLLK